MSVIDRARVSQSKVRDVSADAHVGASTPTKFQKCYIRAATLIGFDAFVAGQGGDPVRLLAEAGIAANVLDAPDGLINFRNYSRLMELATRSLANPSFGLEWAESLAPRFPPWAQSC